jgi:ribosomal protein L11 methylase PrmA
MSPVVLVLLIITLVSIIYYLWYVTFSPQSGPVYVPTKDKTVKKMIEMADLKKGNKVIDLGSGDGRILIEAAKKGATAIGYEIDPILVAESKRKIAKAGVSNKAKVKLKNMWEADFNEVDVIFVYLFPKYLAKLKKLLEEKLTHPVTVISNDYQIPDTKPAKVKDNIYLYQF